MKSPLPFVRPAAFGAFGGAFGAFGRGAAMLGLAVLVAGCGPKGSPKLEGKWLGTKTEGVDPSHQTSADDFARQTVLEFRGDAVAIRTPKGVQMGHYKVISTDKDALTIVTDKDGDDEQHTFVFDGASAKSMRWKILPQRTIVLAKQ